jgi:hypothetical protein
MKITRRQLRRLIKEEQSRIIKEQYYLQDFPFRLSGIDDVISELWTLEGGQHLADKLQGWWDMLQAQPGFSYRDTSDKFSGRS